MMKKRSENLQEILSSIYASALKFLKPMGVEQTYKIIIDEAIKLVGGEYGNIFLEARGELKRVYYSTPLSLGIEIRRGGNRYKAFKENKAMIIYAKKLSDLKKVHPTLKEMNARSILLVPLANADKPYGLLTIVSKKYLSFSKKDLEILKLFGSFATSAIRKNQLYEQVREALNSRDLFISLAAHELRTPLTTINGYIQLVLTKIRNKKPVQKKWFIEMNLEAQRLKTLIDEFLEINKIRTGKIQFNWQETSLKDLINRALTTFMFNYPTRKVNYKEEINSSTRIIADPDKAVQVFVNILENAHKYSKGNKEIFLKLKEGSDFFTVYITDQGQGIEEKDLPFVFKGFYKGENSKHEGMGLGLFLTKNIVDAHHGEISIDSEVGKGTSVRIKLPKI